MKASSSFSGFRRAQEAPGEPVVLTRRAFLVASVLSPAISYADMAWAAARTPYDYGARGGAVLGTCTLAAGEKRLPGVSADDAGKVVMIADGASNGRSLVTRVMADGTLAESVSHDVRDAAYHIGHDDTQALQRFLTDGGGVIPDDIFLCQKPPLRYASNCEVRWRGTILIGEGWPSAFSIMGESYGWTGTEPRIRNVRFLGEGGKATLLLSPANIEMNPWRKGIGITCTDDFVVANLSITGGPGSLFALQIHYSGSGMVRDCRLSVDPLERHQGADGIHFLGNCSDVEVVGLHTWTGDDSSSQTSEIVQSRNTRIERITYRDCVLENVGHSGVKALVTPAAGASVIRDITYSNCRFVTHLAAKGHGVPFILHNEGRQNSAIIERITISGGETVVLNDKADVVAAAAVQLRGIDEFVMENHRIDHCGRTAVEATDCRGLRIAGVRIAPRTKVPPPTMGRQVPVVRLNDCADAQVDTAGISPSYSGQPLTNA